MRAPLEGIKVESPPETIRASGSLRSKMRDDNQGMVGPEGLEPPT